MASPRAKASSAGRFFSAPSCRMSALNRLNAMIPGKTTMKGMTSFRKAANTMPRWPSLSVRAPSVRWVMYWFRPQ